MLSKFIKRVIFLFFLLFLLCPVFVLAEQIDINSATLSQLDELTGIGPVYAQRIIDGRPYLSINDLDRVKGIGPATLQKIKDQGLACVNCANTQTVLDTLENKEVTQTTNTIYFNEILPNPSGTDESNEWIELYNPNNLDVDLFGWQIKDTAGTITTYTIPQSTKILANGFLIFKRLDTKIMLNNDSDGLLLLTPDGKTIDAVSYVKAPLGQSYNKINSKWAWSTTLSPNQANIITGLVIPAKATTAALPNLEKSDNNKITDLTQEELKSNNPWFLFFTALAITIILAISILFIKFKFLKENVRT